MSILQSRCSSHVSHAMYFVGFLQYIESTPVAEVLGTEGSIQNFFRKYHPSETGPYGIAPDVMDTYTSSCGNLDIYLHSDKLLCRCCNSKFVKLVVELLNDGWYLNFSA